MIPYGKQTINQDDIDAVVDVLRSDFLTQGPKVAEFEADLANYCKAKYSLAVNNATAALHLTYLAIGLKPGDIVWTTPNTFVATANAALYCGATIEFVDIDSRTYNLSIDHLKKKLVKAKQCKALPKLVVPVHFAGQSCEMKAIRQLSKEYGFKVVEDASHALGGEYMGNKVGCCEYSDMAVFSFHPVKMITTGEGGAITTNNEKYFKKIQMLRSHGITKNADEFIYEADGGWYYEQKELGFNYRLTDMQAALGISQLKRLNSFVDRRREIARQYCDKLDKNMLPYQHPDTSSSWHLFVLQIQNRREVYQRLKSQGIMTQVHYIPLTNQPYYSQKSLPNTRVFYQNCLSLPIFVDLSQEQQMKVILNLQ